MATNTYESPLSSRYASDEMLYIFSADKNQVHDTCDTDRSESHVRHM